MSVSDKKNLRKPLLCKQCNDDISYDAIKVFVLGKPFCVRCYAKFDRDFWIAQRIGQYELIEKWGYRFDGMCLYEKLKEVKA